MSTNDLDTDKLSEEDLDEYPEEKKGYTKFDIVTCIIAIGITVVAVIFGLMHMINGWFALFLIIASFLWLVMTQHDHMDDDEDGYEYEEDGYEEDEED